MSLMIQGYTYFRKLTYSNVKMKADERHQKRLTDTKRHKKKIKKCKAEAV